VRLTPKTRKLARARAALGDIEGARTAIEELVRVADATGSQPLEAAIALLRVVAETAAGSHELARTALEDAIDGYQRCGLPFEAAEAGRSPTCCGGLARVGRPTGRSVLPDGNSSGSG
jgi:hypothetical protein